MDENGLRARQTRTLDGHGLVECWCQVRALQIAELLWFDAASLKRGERIAPQHWRVSSEMCKCNGRGYVCAVCLGKGVVIRRGEGGGWDARYCEACSTVRDGAIVPQLWYQEYLNESHR